MPFLKLSGVAYRRLMPNREENLTKYAGSIDAIVPYSGRINLRRLREPAEICMRVWGGCGFNLVRRGSGAEQEFFLRVTEKWSNACETGISKNFNATESLWHKSDAEFASGGETTDCSIQLWVNLQEIRSTSWQLELLVNECPIWLE